MSLSADIRRYVLRLHQYEKAVAAGATGLDPPRKPTIAEASAEANEYSSKYHAKFDQEPKNANAMAMVAESARV